MLVALDRVLGAPVVKAWRALQLEAHLTAHRHDPAHQPLAMLGVDRLRNGHEVLDLAHTIGGQEASDENVGVGEVQLLGRTALIGGS